MADEMSSSAWVLLDDGCECGGPPPQFHLPPPPIPPDLPCELLDLSCPAQLNMSDAEFKRIGSFPSLAVIISCTLLSAVILLVIAAIFWRKHRKGVTQTKDFDHHQHLGQSMANGNGILYEDLAHARPRPPIATPSIEMLDINHHGLGLPNGSKLDFSYFLNPPPIYEELPELDPGQSDRNNGPSEDEFAEDELSVIDVPVMSQGHLGLSNTHGTNEAMLPSGAPQPRGYNNNTASSRSTRSRAQSLNRKQQRNAATGRTSNSTNYKSQRSLDRRGRNSNSGGTKYPGTNPRQTYVAGRVTTFNPSAPTGGPSAGMIILSDHHTGMTMKIPPHLVAVLTESALCNGGTTRPYEVIPTSSGHAGLILTGPGGGNGGMYPSSRSSGSSYGDGSSSSSTRVNPNGTSGESGSFDSGIGQHSIPSCINSPAYDQATLLQYSMNPYEYSSTPLHNGSAGNQYLSTAQQQQHPCFRRLRMTPSDRDHPLYSNHLLN